MKARQMNRFLLGGTVVDDRELLTTKDKKPWARSYKIVGQGMTTELLWPLRAGATPPAIAAGEEVMAVCSVEESMGKARFTLLGFIPGEQDLSQFADLLAGHGSTRTAAGRSSPNTPRG